jgi:O-antigen/teichoic acid export membrane protein
MEAQQSHVVRFLRWSEKYTKTDMLYLARGGLWSVIGQGVAILSTLALAMVVSRYVPKSIYGEYKYVLSIIALLSVFSLNGLSSSIFQSVAHGFDGALREAFWKNLRWSILVFAGALVIALYYFYFGNYPLALGILIGGSLSPFLASANLSSSFLLAKKDFARNAIYFDIVATIIPVTTLIITALLIQSSFFLVAAYFISNAVVALYLYRRIVRIYKPDARSIDSGMHSYGKHLSIMGVFGALAGSIDQVLLFHFVGPVQLAIYNFATAIPDQAKGPLKTFDSMVQARFATRTDLEIQGGAGHKIFILSIFYTVATIAYIIAAPFIYSIFFPGYIDSVFYSQIYALSILSFPLGIASSYLAVKKRVREQYIVTLSFAVFQIISMIIGVIWWGLIGVVVARVLSRTFSGLFSYILFRQLRDE